MSCQKYNEYMMSYFDANINDIEMASLKQHLKLCKNCSNEFEGLKSVLNAIDINNGIEPPENFEAEVISKIKSYEVIHKKLNERLIAFFCTSVTIAMVVSVIILSEIINAPAVRELLGRFGVFSGMLLTIYNIVDTIFVFAAGILNGLVTAVFLIGKTYYNVFAVLVSIILLMYGMLVSTYKPNKGGAQ